MMNTILQSKNVSKTYGEGATAFTALHPTNVQLERGKTHVIMGKSGSGKTTLLHLLSGLEQPTHGSIIYKGQNLLSFTEKQLSQIRGQHFGFVFQSFELIPELSVYDNITLPQIFTKSKINPGQIRSLAKSLGILDKLDQLPNSLSGGEKQRTAIARAMINQPEIIFADEPTGNLDKTNSRMVIKLLKQNCEMNKQTLVIVTHDEQLLPNPDYLYWMEDGKLLLQSKE